MKALVYKLAHRYICVYKRSLVFSNEILKRWRCIISTTNCRYRVDVQSNYHLKKTYE